MMIPCTCALKRSIKRFTFTLKGALKLDVKKALRQGRAARKPRSSADERAPRFREPMVMIHDRPGSEEQTKTPTASYANTPPKAPT